MKDNIKRKESSQAFFARNPVFTAEDFGNFLRDEERLSEQNRKRLLSYHKKKGHLVSVRPGLYGAIPLGTSAETFLIDSYLIAAHLTRDAVLGYHTALTFHGVAHSRREEVNIITQHPLVRPFRFQGISYRTVTPPRAIVAAKEINFNVETHERQGQEVRVTGLERTLVDMLDRLPLSGGWEEVWRSYEAVPYLNLDMVVQYALLLDNATTIAKVGFLLQNQQVPWMVGDKYLATLHAHRPRQPQYADRYREERVRMIPDWNLILPERVVNRTWEETYEPIA